MTKQKSIDGKEVHFVENINRTVSGRFNAHLVVTFSKYKPTMKKGVNVFDI